MIQCTCPQRPVFLLGSQHMHKKETNLCIELNWSSNLGDNKRRQNTLVTKVVWFQMLDFKTSKSNSEVSKSNSNTLVEIVFFLDNYVTSEGAVSHNVLHYQQLSTACYQISFYANSYF